MYAFRPLSLSLVVTSGIAFVSGAAAAVDADPTNYESILPTLVPGDILLLAPGSYGGNLDITGGH